MAASPRTAKCGEPAESRSAGGTAAREWIASRPCPSLLRVFLLVSVCYVSARAFRSLLRPSVTQQVRVQPSIAAPSTAVGASRAHSHGPWQTFAVAAFRGTDVASAFSSTGVALHRRHHVASSAFQRFRSRRAFASASMRSAPSRRGRARRRVAERVPQMPWPASAAAMARSGRPLRRRHRDDLGRGRANPRDAGTAGGASAARQRRVRPAAPPARDRPMRHAGADGGAPAWRHPARRPRASARHEGCARRLGSGIVAVALAPAVACAGRPLGRAARRRPPRRPHRCAAPLRARPCGRAARTHQSVSSSSCCCPLFRKVGSSSTSA